MLAIYIISTVFAGLALDWGLIERLKVNFGAFGVSDEIRYRDLPRWRLILIVIGSSAAGWSLSNHEPLLFWDGIAIFVASNIYGVYVALRRGS